MICSHQNSSGQAASNLTRVITEYRQLSTVTTMCLQFNNINKNKNNKPQIPLCDIDVAVYIHIFSFYCAERVVVGFLEDFILLNGGRWGDVGGRVPSR